MSPRSRARFAHALCSAALTLPGPVAFSSAPGGSTYAYEYSRDPKKIVLFVQSLGTYVRTSTSVTLFGDGRLLVSRKDLGGPLREYETALNPDEIDGLIRSLIESGLAEWDDARIEAEQLKRTGGIVPITTDADAIHVTLCLEFFERGGWKVRPLEKRIRFAAAHETAEAFPDVPELEGLVMLEQFTKNSYERAAGTGE